MEMHLVHVKKDYLDDVNEALASPDGLAVVGIMFVVGDEDFAPLQVCDKNFILRELFIKLLIHFDILANS